MDEAVALALNERFEGRHLRRAYLRAHDPPRNPLYDLGYAQIGCAPCTGRVAPDGHERDGRWDGSLKVECGLHAPEPASRG